ncbi:MAG: response regulator [Nitrososphaerales archaeon]
MTLNEGQRRFSQSFVDAIKLERNKKYEAASELYLNEATSLQRKKDLEHSAVCFLLAGRCKLQAEKSASEDFEKAAKIYLEIANQIKDTSPMDSRMAYRCAAKCFLRAELYGRAHEAQRSANSIKQVRVAGLIKQPIMIVDDSKVVTLKLKNYVTQFGFHEIVICNSGREALEKFKKLISGRQFPIVLLDMGMPDITGNEVASQMLKIRPETTIALITAHSIDSDSVKEALANGVSYFLRKPFRYNEMKELLETIQYEETVI